MRVSFARAVATLLGVATVASCSVLGADDHDGATSTPVADLPAPNMQAWTLPMDGLLISDADDFKRVFAEALLAHDCLAQRSVQSPDPTLDVLAAEDSPIRAGDGTRNLTAQNASKFGYLGGTDRGFLTDLNAFLEWESIQTGDIGTAVAECSADASEHFNSDGAYQDANVMAALIYQAFNKAAESDAAVAAARDWNLCVAGKGIVGAASTPDGMPTSEMVHSLGNNTGDTASAWVPSETELAWATADAQCQVESGYRDALYTAEWDAQVQTLGEQNGDVIRARANLEEWRASIDSVIAAHPAEHR